MRKNKNEKKSYSCFEEKYRGLTNPVKRIRRWGRNIKHSYQRIKYGYCDRDVWSIDWWFLNVITNMLHDLRETAHGFPDEVGKMVGYDDQNIDPKKEQEAIEKWDSILDEIIFYLREANEDTCQKKNSYEEQYQSNWDEFNEKYAGGEKLKTAEEKAEEKNKGLQLFSKWFWNLWD